MDPNFSVLLGEDNKNKTCEPSVMKSTKSLTGTILATSFAITAAAAILAALFRFLYLKLTLANQLRNSKQSIKQESKQGQVHGQGKRKSLFQRLRSKSNEDDESLAIERMNDMEVYTEAGKFVVNM